MLRISSSCSSAVGLPLFEWVLAGCTLARLDFTFAPAQVPSLLRLGSPIYFTLASARVYCYSFRLEHVVQCLSSGLLGMTLFTNMTTHVMCVGCIHGSDRHAMVLVPTDPLKQPS